MPFFETNDGCRIFFHHDRSAAAKPVVVFLNGAMQSAVNWQTVSKLMDDEFQTLRYDARGQGRSELGRLPLSLGLHASDLRNLLEFAGIEKAHLAGLSHGAAVALEFACRFPSIADKLTLFSVAASPSRRSRLLLKSWAGILDKDGLEAMAWAVVPIVFGERFLRLHGRILAKLVKGIVARNRRESLLAHFHAMSGFSSLSDRAAGVTNAVLVVSASDDPLVSADGARELAGLCRGIHRELRGIGHSIPAEAPEALADLLKEHFSPAFPTAPGPDPAI